MGDGCAPLPLLVIMQATTRKPLQKEGKLSIMSYITEFDGYLVIDPKNLTRNEVEQACADFQGIWGSNANFDHVGDLLDVFIIYGKGVFSGWEDNFRNFVSKWSDHIKDISIELCGEDRYDISMLGFENGAATISYAEIVMHPVGVF